MVKCTSALTFENFCQAMQLGTRLGVGLSLCVLSLFSPVRPLPRAREHEDKLVRRHLRDIEHI